MAKWVDIGTLVLAIFAAFVPVGGLAISAAAVVLAAIVGLSGRPVVFNFCGADQLHRCFSEPRALGRRRNGPSRGQGRCLAIIAVLF
jgi:hypothetical protein